MLGVRFLGKIRLEQAISLELGRLGSRMTLKRKLAAGVFCALACMPMVAETAPKSDTMHRWEVTSKDTGGTLLFSDSPEYVDRPGILYQDTVNGEVRVLYYHLNNTKVPQKVAVVLENANSEEKYNIVQVTRGGTAKPSEYYLWVGKNTQRQYFGEKELDLVLLLKNRKRLLQSGMDEIVLQPGELVYGVYDFKVDHPVKTSVIMYPAKADPVEFIEKAKVLPRDSVALRGTYKGMDRVITSEREYDPERDGIVYIMLADNKLDKYKAGVDATDGSQTMNCGNYGVLYIRLLYLSKKGLPRYSTTCHL